MLSDSGSEVQRMMIEARERYNNKFKRKPGKTTSPAEEDATAPGNAEVPPRFDPGTSEAAADEPYEEDDLRQEESTTSTPNDDTTTMSARDRRALARDKRNTAVVDAGPLPKAHPLVADARTRRIERRAEARRAQLAAAMPKAAKALQASLLLLSDQTVEQLCETLGDEE